MVGRYKLVAVMRERRYPVFSPVTWKVGRVWFIASVLKTEEQKCSVSSNLTLSSSRCTNDTIATIRNATASYHRMGYLRVSHSAGIHRIDFCDTKETRIIFPPKGLG